MLGYWPEDLSPIPGGLAVRWGNRPVGEIDGHDVWSIIDEARRLGVPGRPVRNPGLSEARGRALLAILSSLFGWLQRQRRVATNPCAGIHHPPASKPRDRVLSGDELRWLWLACDEVEEPYHSIFRLLALSGQRLNEVAGMRREELRDDGMWHLPGSRTKNHLAHLVPLPPLAQSIIAAVPPGQNQFVFTTSAGRPPTHWSKAKSKLDAAMLALARKECGPDAVIEPWRLHDLRRGFVTGLVEIGVPPHVVEQVVNHGDLALMNALWDGEVVALLDFEFAVLGPVEIDLCRLVCEALVSEDGQRSDNDAGAAAFAIAARERDPVHGRALLLGAAVLDQLRDLEIWLGRDRTEDRFEDWRPDRLLTGLLETDGGYLEPALT